MRTGQLIPLQKTAVFWTPAGGAGMMAVFRARPQAHHDPEAATNYERSDNILSLSSSGISDSGTKLIDAMTPIFRRRISSMFT